MTQAFDRFLTENPDWASRVVLVQIGLEVRFHGLYHDMFASTLTFATFCNTLVGFSP